MSLLVQKFGGKSLGNVRRMMQVANRIGESYQRVKELVVVASAMEGVTEDLIHLAKEISDYPDKRELDVLLAIGEQTSVSILAMTLKHMGYKAQSFLAHQVGLLTNSTYGNAKILEIDISNIRKATENHTIAIVAGFQGCDNNGNITTLGRDGSDTTAVALAGALGAKLCEIYTDIDGIYTEDPKKKPEAEKIKKISYDEVAKMIESGSQILHKNSLFFAKKHNIPIHVRSSFSFEEGTMVVST